FVFAERKFNSGFRGIADEGDAIIRRKTGDKRVRFLSALLSEKIHGRAAFDHENDLGGIVVGEEAGDGLFDAVIEDVKVVLFQALDEISVAIRGDDADAYAADFDANCGSLLLLCGARFRVGKKNAQKQRVRQQPKESSS